MSSAILTYDRQTKRHEVKLVRLVARIMALASSILASCEVADYTVCLRVGRPRRIHNTVELRLARDAIQHLSIPGGAQTITRSHGSAKVL